MTTLAGGFDFVVFPEKIDYVFQGGPMFKTTIIKAGSGNEQRIGQWANGLHTWKAASGPKNAEDMAALKAFYMARYGRLFGFLWKDWNDYRATNMPLVNPGGTSIQLSVTYPDTVRPITRKILLPRYDTSETKGYNGFHLYADSVLLTPVTDYTFDFGAGTGIITLTVAHTGAALTWTGEFYTPVRFDSDQQLASRDSMTEFNWADLGIVELKKVTA